MNIKKKIRNSWQTEQLSNEFDKKDYLKFKPKSSFRISLSFYILSMSCVILIFTSILLVDKIGINTETEEEMVIYKKYDV